MRKRELLDKLFPQFEPSLRELLSEKCTLQEFAAGDSLLKPGQFFRSTILIAHGRIKIYRENEQGQEFFMYDIGPGEACALSLICASKMTSSEIRAQAVEDGVALMVPIALMDELTRDFKTWYYFVLETYRDKFEELLLTIDQIAFKKLDERLENYLSREVRMRNSRHLEISHQQIAAELNSSREVISRLLKKMEQHGVIALYRNSIDWLR